MPNLTLPQKIKLFFEKIFDPAKPKWIYICLCVLMSLGIFSSFIEGKKNTNEQTSVSATGSGGSADTYIPFGYVLVPLEISNALTVSNLMGQYTIVDIYTSVGIDDRQKKVIAQNLRMVKAPHDENQFAVLVKDSEYNLIHNLSEPVFIVIKNPNTKKSETITKEEQQLLKVKKSRISYGY